MALACLRGRWRAACWLPSPPCSLGLWQGDAALPSSGASQPTRANIPEQGAFQILWALHAWGGAGGPGKGWPDASWFFISQPLPDFQGVTDQAPYSFSKVGNIQWASGWEGLGETKGLAVPLRKAACFWPLVCSVLLDLSSQEQHKALSCILWSGDGGGAC